MEPPVGTVGLLFTDIEGSTALAHALGSRFADVLAAHHDVVGGAIAAHGGYVDGTEGDAFFALFGDPPAALAAAVDAQEELRRRPWPTPDGRLRVRMGVHVGFVEHHPTGYVGLEIHRAARVASAAHGGQVLLTATAAAFARDLPLEDLGRHRLKDFPAPERLFCTVIAGEGADAFPPIRSLEVRPTNLPPDDRPLVGRAEAVSAVVRALTEDGERLVTLTGMGGSGKTRLALAAGAALLDAHRGGVWWVPLATAADHRGIPSALAAAMRIADDGSRPLPAAIAGRVGEVPTLAVLDNLEHLPGAAGTIGDLLAVAPGLRVLATSQGPLRSAAELVLPVEPLRREASRELFARTGARARPGFALDPETTAIADALCERLDHLPLAIELAAARLAVLTPRQLLDRLRAPLQLLRGGPRDAPERQRSLAAMIEWTLGLLDPEPRALFTRLGAFAGAVELEDLEAVCAGDDVEVLDAVAGLLAVGLLRRREDGSGAVRFRLPETLRQVAVAELDAHPDADRWRRAHARHVADAAWPGSIPMACTGAAYRRALALQPEVAFALQWAWAHDPALACRLAAGRAAHLAERALAEALALADAVDACPAAPPETRAMSAFVRAWTRHFAGDHAEALALCRSAAAALPQGSDERSVVVASEVFLLQVGGLGDWRPVQERLLQELRAHGTPHALANAYFNQAQVAAAAGDVALGRRSLEEAEAVGAGADAKCLWHLDSTRGDLTLAAGDPAACDAYLRSIDAALRFGDVHQIYFDLHGIANALVVAGRPEDALETWGVAMSLGEQVGKGLDDLADDDVYGEGRLDAARSEVGPVAADAAIARGRAVAAGRRIEHVRQLLGTAVPSPR